MQVETLCLKYQIITQRKIPTKLITSVFFLANEKCLKQPKIGLLCKTAKFMDLSG